MLLRDKENDKVYKFMAEIDPITMKIMIMLQNGEKYYYDSMEEVTSRWELMNVKTISY